MIVALLGWTVNQPLKACSGRNSRAAVGVLAGASPAKPEPSPSRHNCCPHEGMPSAVAKSAPVSDCVFHLSPDMRCCSASGNSAYLPTPRTVQKSQPVKYLTAPSASCLTYYTAPSQARCFSQNSPPFAHLFSFTVLRN